jgi:hypothetical protein
VSEEPIDRADLGELRRTIAMMPALSAVPPHAREPLIDATMDHVSTYMGGYLRDLLEARLGGFDREDPTQSGSSTSGTKPAASTKTVTCKACGNVFTVTCP